MKKVSLGVGLIFLCTVAAFGQSASGNFRFNTEDGAQTVEFSARTSDGRTTGGLLYSGTLETPVQDVDGTGERTGGKFPDWFVKVDLDCLAVNLNRASLSGLVRDSSQREMIGRRMILAVEDNADKEPDRYSWGLYDNVGITWIPSDAELKFDEGWSLSWEASDFERKDDVPVRINRDTTVDCRSFPLASYELDQLGREGGDIVVATK